MNWEKAFQFFTQPFVTFGKTPVTIATVVQFVVMLVVVVLIARVTRRLLRDRLLVRTKLDVGLQEAIARITGYVVLALGFMIGLQTLGIEMSSLNVLAGALGVGLGFGLRNVVENFVSGLIILGERPIQIGDRIEVGSSAGRVSHIGARSTTIRTNEEIAIIIPNSEFIKEKVINWSHGTRRRRFSIPIGVAFNSDARQVEKLLLEIGKNAEGVLDMPAPSVRLMQFGESSIDFELRVWTSVFLHNPATLNSQINFTIWEKFKEHQIEIPYVQRDLHLREPLQVEMKKERGYMADEL
ncbi:MAG: mechanosensitive ion channel domain-containing protein [Methylococcaceae bacterium]